MYFQIIDDQRNFEKTYPTLSLMLCLLNCLQLNYPNKVLINASLLKAIKIYLITVIF